MHPHSLLRFESGNRLAGNFSLARVVLYCFVFCLAFQFCWLESRIRLPAQDKVTLTRQQWETGFNAMAQILRKRGAELSSSFDQWRNYPATERILILMGRVTPEDQAYLDQFVMRGGSALLATDTDCGPFRVDRHEISITQGGSVFAARSRDRYLRNDGWPIISLFEADEPLFDGIRRIVPNYPALLKIRPTLNRATGWQTIARYPMLRNQGFNRPFAVRFLGARGERLLVVPDHSIYVNGAVSVEDNLLFMLNTVDWLRAGNRTRCLFVLNGNTVAPSNVSQVNLYSPPPGAAETQRALRELWKRTTIEQKLELANEALEFAQQERLIEQMVDAIKPEELISSPNRLLAVILVIGSWCVIITFVVLLVSNRKQPLGGKSIDGLQMEEKKMAKHRERLERLRAAEAMFVHFFSRLGLAVNRPEQVDEKQLLFHGDERETRRLRKEIRRVREDLIRQSIDHWTPRRVEEVGRYIAQWANLSETGLLRIENRAGDPRENAY